MESPDPITAADVYGWLLKNVKGKGYVTSAFRLSQKMKIDRQDAEKALKVLAEKEFMRVSWVFYDEDDESYELSEDEITHFLETGEYYHPNTLAPVANAKQYVVQHFIATDRISDNLYSNPKPKPEKSDWYNDNMFVIRTDDIGKLKTFLENFGLSFQQEQHGKGPVHFSCVVQDKVLEIYPVKR